MVVDILHKQLRPSFEKHNYILCAFEFAEAETHGEKKTDVIPRVKIGNLKTWSGSTALYAACTHS